MSAVELVVLDMAGTTIEQGGEIVSAFESALKQNEIPADEEEIRERMGASKMEVIRFFVERHGGKDGDSAGKVKSAYSDFQRTLFERYAKGGARPIPGVEAAFARLREHGIKIALTTGFGREIANAVLKSVSWGSNVIDASLCSDDVPWGRPAPFMIFRAMEATGVFDARRVIVVGDTVLDLQAGANAAAGGIVGVLSGSHGLEQLGKILHTHLLDSAAQLPDLIENEFVERKVRSGSIAERS